VRISEYSMHTPDHTVSTPKGSRFLGAGYDAAGTLQIYFEVASDYTQMRHWHFHLSTVGRDVGRDTGWTPDQYHLVETLPGNGTRPTEFLFWKS
jgi:hypothetical protein